MQNWSAFILPWQTVHSYWNWKQRSTTFKEESHIIGHRTYHHCCGPQIKQYYTPLCEPHTTEQICSGGDPPHGLSAWQVATLQIFQGSIANTELELMDLVGLEIAVY